MKEEVLGGRGLFQLCCSDRALILLTERASNGHMAQVIKQVVH